jgi:hypothetical protein
MDVTSRFALDTHPGPYETWPTTSRLIVDGMAVDTRIRGFVIDGQYETGIGTLLLTSYDCPYEEASAFTLLDARQRVLAQRELGAPYSSMLLHGHWPIDAATLALHFHGERFYTLRVQAPGRLPWQRHRLVLREELDWRKDPRMRDAQQRLAVELEAIRRSLDESRDRDGESRRE